MTQSADDLAQVERRASMPSVASEADTERVSSGDAPDQAVVTSFSLPALFRPVSIDRDGAGNAAGHVGVLFDGSVLFSDGSMQRPTAREASELVTAMAPATCLIEVLGHGPL